MKVTEFFESSEGDIYSISLSFENGGLIADDIRRNMEKSGRNYILKSMKDYGAGIRQLSRLTGVSYGVIQKL